MKKQVLVVHEDTSLKDFIQSALGDLCEVKYVQSIEQASSEIKAGTFSLLLIDADIPEGRGFTLCRRLREQKNLEDLTIVVMVSEGKNEDKMGGLEAGADDYIVKPLEKIEMRARTLGRLSRKSTKANSIIRIEKYVIDLNKQKVKELFAGTERMLSLTPIEFKLFVHFLQNKEQIFTRQELLDIFWEGSAYVSRHTVDTHISSLRKKMGPRGIHLRSVFKRGYVLRLPEELSLDNESSRSVSGPTV
ncbi:MAG: response regulator transcription factor [Bdellovibrio sp.]|nr:response regulator transcription factor [Bdellovibrio sp.]